MQALEHGVDEEARIRRELAQLRARRRWNAWLVLVPGIGGATMIVAGPGAWAATVAGIVLLGAGLGAAHRAGRQRARRSAARERLFQLRRAKRNAAQQRS